MFDVTEDFAIVVLKQSRYDNFSTPLHGTENVPVQRALHLDGFKYVDTVAAQRVPDGNFPTVISYNSEDRHALEMGIAQAKETGADIVLGTDPDK